MKRKKIDHRRNIVPPRSHEVENLLRLGRGPQSPWILSLDRRQMIGCIQSIRSDRRGTQKNMMSGGAKEHVSDD